MADGTEELYDKKKDMKTPAVQLDGSPLDAAALLTLKGSSDGRSGAIPKKTQVSTSRSSSPQTRSKSSGLSNIDEVKDRADAQLQRMAMLEEIAALIESTERWSLQLIDEFKRQVESLSSDIKAESEALQLMWSSEVSSLPYFTNKVQLKATQLSFKLRRDLANHQSLLAPTIAQPSISSTEHVSKLPDINLPHFDGTYSQWPYFKDMFRSLIYQNQQLSQVQKLHYLRSCLSGEPAQIVSAYKLCDSSLEPTMTALETRYDNKRLLVQAHIDKLISMTPLSQKTSEGLNNIACVTAEVKQGLEALNVKEKLGDMLLVHIAARNLDRSTKEAWENSLGMSQEYPTSAQFEQFVRARARALERVELLNVPKSTSRTEAKTSTKQKSSFTSPRSAHQASQALSLPSSSAQSSVGHASVNKTTSFIRGPTAHSCDYCQENHFIVACPIFRALSLDMRMDVIVARKLCFNCLGRHSARSCKSTHRCKTCNDQHHTMLHGYKPRVIPSATLETQKISSPESSH